MSDNTLGFVAENVVSVEDARNAILRSLEAGNQVTQNSLIVGVINESGADVAAIFVQALKSLLDEGKIHSTRGRNGGLKLGAPKPKDAKSLAAAMLAAAKKSK